MSAIERKPIFKNSKRTFTLRRYSTIDYVVMESVGINEREWRICENIEYWCNHEHNGFVAITRAELGKLLGISADRAKYIVRSLVDRKFLKVSKNYHLATTSKWKKMMDANGSEIPSNFLNEKSIPKVEETPEETSTVEKKVEQKVEKKVEQKVEKKEKKVETVGFPYFEAEFGEDEKSVVDRPSLNQVRKKALNLQEKNKISKKLAIEISTSFWRKKENERWKNTANFFSSLKRYMNLWLKYAEKYPEKFPEREKRIVTPTNSEEMRLFLKQMNDEEREKLSFNTQNKGVIVIDSRTGVPIFKETGAYLSDTEYDNFMTFLLGNFRKGKIRVRGLDD